MKALKLHSFRAVAILPALAIMALIFAPAAPAHGVAGDDVEDLQEHLPEYAESVQSFLGAIEKVVTSYETSGAAQTESAVLIEAWEKAEIHAAIELNYIPLYAEIWQGIYGIKEGIEAGKPAAGVRETQAALTKTLWQSLGAVKMAAKVQEERRTAGQGSAGENEAMGSAAALQAIKGALDRVVGKSAERDFEAAKKMVHETYETLFEGVEGELKGHDAPLVADLEKALNVALPLQLEQAASLAAIKETVATIKTKLDRAVALLGGPETE